MLVAVLLPGMWCCGGSAHRFGEHPWLAAMPCESTAAEPVGISEHHTSRLQKRSRSSGCAHLPITHGSRVDLIDGSSCISLSPYSFKDFSVFFFSSSVVRSGLIFLLLLVFSMRKASWVLSSHVLVDFPTPKDIYKFTFVGCLWNSSCWCTSLLCGVSYLVSSMLWITLFCLQRWSEQFKNCWLRCMKWQKLCRLQHQPHKYRTSHRVSPLTPLKLLLLQHCL